MPGTLAGLAGSSAAPAGRDGLTADVRSAGWQPVAPSSRNAAAKPDQPGRRMAFLRPGGLFLLLFDGQLRQRLGGADQALPVLLDVLRRAALVGDVPRDLGRGHHVDGVPRAPALAQRAADAAL